MMVEFFRASTPLRLQASGPLGLGEGTGARTPAVLRFVTWGLPCGAQPQRRFFSKATGRLLLVYFATCIVMNLVTECRTQFPSFVCHFVIIPPVQEETQADLHVTRL